MCNILFSMLVGEISRETKLAYCVNIESICFQLWINFCLISASFCSIYYLDDNLMGVGLKHARINIRMIFMQTGSTRLTAQLLYYCFTYVLQKIYDDKAKKKIDLFKVTLQILFFCLH